MAGHEMVSMTDLAVGYNHILMHPPDKEKTAFTTEWGNYCYAVMPFGLKNAGATYQRMATTIFHDLIHKEVEVYVDDMIIKTKTAEEHVVALEKVFQRLCKYNLKLNPTKCLFGATSEVFLGYLVSKRGIEIDPAKSKAIWTCHLLKWKRKAVGCLENCSTLAGSCPSFQKLVDPCSNY